jgi:hypothetical protein
MARIQEEILEEFLRRLAKADGFTEVKVAQIRDLFGGAKRPKATDVTKVLSESLKENLP